MAQGVGRFQVMAVLQATRASVLGLPMASAKSWGLNRAIFYAAAKRGFTGGGPSRTARPPEGEPAPVEFMLGDDKAYAVTRGGIRLFTIGGQVQDSESFARQVEQRFAGTFRAAWSEAREIVRLYPRAVLESPGDFYGQVYRPRRDELARAWSQRAAAPAGPRPAGARRSAGARRGRSAG